MKVALYARVSTTDQNCELQLRELREYCARRRWEVIDEYVDTGICGTRASMPQLNRLMQDAAARAVDAVVVWKVDRWSRSVRDLRETLEQLRRWHVRWVATAQCLDTDEHEPSSRLLVAIIRAVAEIESNVIRERVVAGQRTYRNLYARGRVGRTQDRQSKSGLNRPIGRPRCVVDRYRLHELREQGHSLRQIGAKIGVSYVTVWRLLQEARNAGRTWISRLPGPAS